MDRPNANPWVQGVRDEIMPGCGELESQSRESRRGPAAIHHLPPAAVSCQALGNKFGWLPCVGPGLIIVSRLHAPQPLLAILHFAHAGPALISTYLVRLEQHTHRVVCDQARPE